MGSVCTHANRTGKIYPCPQKVKEPAYKGLVCPVLEYGSSVWDSHGVVLQEECGVVLDCIYS